MRKTPSLNLDDASLIDRAVVFLGSLTLVGLLCGYAGIRILSASSALVAIAVCCAVTAVLVKRDAQSQIATRTSSPTTERIVWVIPLIFMLSATRWLLRSPGRRLNWLLSTWDGTTNPGIVTYSYRLGNIGNDRDVLSQWQDYPRSPHFAVGLTSRIFDGIGLDGPTTRTTLYALMLWSTFALLLVAAGHLASVLARRLTAGTGAVWVSGLLTQAALVSGWFLDRTILLHALGFLTCGVALLGMLRRLIDSRPLTCPASMAVVGLYLVVILETYPLALPFFAAILAILLLRDDCFTQSFTAWIPLLLSASVFAPRLYRLGGTTADTERLTAGGHIIALPLWIAMAIGVVSLIVAIVFFARKLHDLRDIAWIIVTFIAIVLALWLTADGFSRRYGTNYYAKKTEMLGFVCLLPLVIAPVIVEVTRRINGLNHRRLALFVTATFVILALVSGPLAKPATVGSTADSRAELMVESLREASIPSESIILSDDAYSSTYASMFSNLADSAFWSRGRVNVRLVRINQQVSARANRVTDSWFCRIVWRKDAAVLRVADGTVKRLDCVDDVATG